ncbi:MAG: UDP-2,4-diacetamido-2,4,6-trideoxy-beta-L-altropyranose hydrolase [Kiloniellaceae bacterium]
MNPMRVVFRFDASPALGAGHAYRCMTLAQSLAQLGWTCHCVANSQAADTVPRLRSNPAFTLGDAATFAGRETDWLVVDHYGLDAAWERQCRGWAKSILVIDDLADRAHDCDLLLDQTYGRSAEDYAGVVPSPCRLLTGSDYALLRPDFARARQGSLHRRRGPASLQRILVSLGATDPGNYSLETLKGIAESHTTAAVDVVLGAGAPHLHSVRTQIAAMAQEVRLHVDTANMPELLTQSDLAIGAAGTSTWERCCLGLPTLLVVVAENQRRTAEAVSGAGAARLVPGPRAALAGQIAGELRSLATDRAALLDMSGRSAGICDGRGCDRLGLALVPPGCAKDGRPVALRLAGPADEAPILEWQHDPATRRFARNPAVPTAEEHRRWFAARLANPNSLLTVITHGDAPAGVLRLDPIAAADTEGDAPAFEVSILVAPDRRGVGLALEALCFLRRWHSRAVIAAEVLSGNEASAALFRVAGYRPGAGGLLYSHPPQPAMT